MKTLLLPWGAALLCAAALVATSAGAAQTEAFVSHEARFAAAFPSTPVRERTERETWAGKMEEGSFDVTAGGVRLRVEYHDVPKMATAVLPPRLILDLARQGVVDDMGARGTVTEPVSLHGHPGLALRYSPAEHPHLVEEARLFLVGSRLYVAFARAEEPGEPEQAAAQFLASFDAWEAGETVAALGGSVSGGM